jgi:hypothetical protein
MAQKGISAMTIAQSEGLFKCGPPDTSAGALLYDEVRVVIVA